MSEAVDPVAAPAALPAAEPPPPMPAREARAADQRAGAEAIAQVAARPTAYDLFRAMRQIERAHPHLPLLGDAMRPGDEPFRFGEEPALTFAPAAITRIEPNPNGPPRLVQRVFGFLGPNGALPIHMTEYVRDRLLHHGDATVLRFLGMLLHRFGLFFYRAWARSSPVVSLDRDTDSALVRQLGSVIGIGEATQRRRDAIGDFAKLHYVGRLARSVRDADGLESWLRLHFQVPVRVEQFCGHWMQLDASERSRLTALGQPGLGRGAVLGAQMWDVQHKFRIVIGPLPWRQFAALLPGGSPLAQLRSMVRQYVGFEFGWDVRLVLRAGDVPAWRLGAPGGAGQLGRTSWMNGRRARTRDADELVMNVESLRMAEAV